MKNALKIMDNINLKVCYVSMVATFFLMCMTTVHALIRKFANSGGVTDSLGITELCMVLIVFCGFAYMESENGHVRVDILVSKFPKRFASALHGVLLVVTGLFIFVIFYAVAGNVTTIYARGAATQVLHIPNWPFWIVIAVGLFVYAVTVLLHGIQKFGDAAQAAKEAKDEGDGELTFDVTNQI